MKILGISAFYHDSSVALIENGKILFAAQEERYTRIKHDHSFPIKSLVQSLKYCKLELNDIDKIVFYEKPLLKFERIIETILQLAPKGFKGFRKGISEWTNQKFFLKNHIIKNLKKIDKNFNNKSKILFSEHHLSHLASSFYPSPFDEALLLSIDGVGEWSTITIASGKNQKIDILHEIKYPHSLGLIYSAFTSYLGFSVNDGEYKLMGLAPYGSPKYYNLILDKLINVEENGSFTLNMTYFDFLTGDRMVNSKFEELFNKISRNKNHPIEEFHADIAASIQKVLEHIVIKILNFCKNKYDFKYLCLSGGVALNCVLNGKIIKNKLYQDVWIQPASGDAGGSIGAALAYYYSIKGTSRKIDYHKDSMNSSLLGNCYSNDEYINELNRMKASYKNYKDVNELADTVADLISNEKIIAIHWGRMEFGPRSLGNRAIIADPRSSDMQKKLNLKTKFRESFRPFAPIILEDEVSKWFDLDTKSPYMLIVSEILEHHKIQKNESNKIFDLSSINNKRSIVPSITHVDFSSRIQTVSNESEQFILKVIKSFYKKTNVPILINTSFNISDEPIVESVEDAYKCFLFSDIDYLVAGENLLKKSDQYENANLPFN